MKKSLVALLLLSMVAGEAYSQTIAEKKAALQEGTTEGLGQDLQRFLGDVNKELKEYQTELLLLYQQVQSLYECDAPQNSYEDLLEEINQVRANILILESNWREMATKSGMGEEVGYALWHQPDTTLQQLVMDYGSQDFVYLIPPDIAAIPLTISSNIPIPRASWGEMLEQILLQNGVGIRELNPFLRQLFLLSEDSSDLRLITSRRQDLDIYPPNTRVSFVLTPQPADVRRVSFFLDKFANHQSTVVQIAGRDILIVGQVGAVKELLKVYDFVSERRSDREYKAIPLQRVDPQQMADILQTIFAPEEMVITQPTEGEESTGSTTSTQKFTTTNNLHIIALTDVAQSLFLVGTKDEIRQAEAMVRQVEGQVALARERVVYWYTAKHSMAEELAEVLSRIYDILIDARSRGNPDNDQVNKDMQQVLAVNQVQKDGLDFIQPDPSRIFRERFYQEGGFIIDPRPIEPGLIPPPAFNLNRDNFIVDQKTGSIVMVVEADLLVKIKEVIRKLDVPKKMVHIEVLLFEKKMTRENNFSLNLLRYGDCANNVKEGCLSWNDLFSNPLNLGVLQFMLSRTASHGIPAFDLIYKFLISQDDFNINSAPSVTTVNQTPAIIAIAQEISINTGIFEVPTEGTVALKDSFTRAQYGTTIQIVPNVHPRESEDEIEYVTISTDVTFDTIVPSGNAQQPNVTRRHVQNEVRVADGESIILGGLRDKQTNDHRSSIPFLGEIPGFGKFFSSTDLHDTSTEMFIIITPKIISDPYCDLRRIRDLEMAKRPGDVPLYLCRLNEALEWESHRFMEGTIALLFGRPRDRCIEEEWDGR